jgi:para-nitrobenzyl esterase
VFFWVHGGGFTGGRSSDEGAAFAANGIVCITTAYRLGVLGFLDVASLLGEQYRGSANNGLRDLITALEWVHENIGSFGGDPSRVTIGGESAGAKLSDILMGTPSAKPLFRQVISESGGAERVSTPMDADAIARGYGSLWTGMTGTPLNAMLTAPASELIRVQDRFMSTWPKHFPLRPEIGTETLPDYPVHTVADSNARGKHLLIGTNRDESAAFIGPHPTAVHAGDLGNITLDQFETVLAKYAHVYPSLPADRRLIRAVTAEEYWMPSIRLAQATESGHGHAWVYRFDYPAESGDLSGYAFHGLELDFVWNTSHAQADPLRAPLASTIHQAWCSFITRGAPAAPGLPSWPESTSQKPQTMILDATSHVEPNVQADEIALWSGVSNTL